MVAGCLVAWISITTPVVGSWSQSPTDPLVFGPGMRVGSRLQYGLNVLPSDWIAGGKPAETSSVDANLKGFQIITVSRPNSQAKRDGNGFSEVPCDFLGTTPIVTVFSQDGSRHRFSVDTGAARSYLKPALAQSLNFGREDPIPMCLYLSAEKWVHFKAEVDRSIAVLSAQDSDFPVDGILGTNAIACLQLKIDYRARKLWARVSSKPTDDKQLATMLGGAASASRLSSIPITRQDYGRFTIDVQFGARPVTLELDTGASLIGLLPDVIADLKLVKVGETQVLIQNGTRALSKYIANDVKVCESRLLWPTIHEGIDPHLKFGGFGPSTLPHKQVILDFPGLRMVTLSPTETELIESGLSQLLSSPVRFGTNEVTLDSGESTGEPKKVITRIQDKPISAIIQDFRLIAKGDLAAHNRILEICRALNTTLGHISIRQGGIESTIAIGSL